LIFDIKRFSVNDGPGIRTTIFFKGCPLNCWWCHNPESRLIDPQEIITYRKLCDKEFILKEIVGKTVSVDDVMSEIEKETVFYETSGGGVTFSGGEPLMQPEFLSALADACRFRNINTCLDTSGYCDKQLFKEFINKIDLFLFDIKTLDRQKHIQYTGVDNTDILSNLLQLDLSGGKYIIRIPVIQGLNSDKESMIQLIEFLRKLTCPLKEIHLLPYHSLAKSKLRRLKMEDKTDIFKEINDSELKILAGEFEADGYKVNIGG
jgi:pyruvate formate lyase activating enzyme